MIWTLTFVAFLVTGDAKVSGGVFTSKAQCESIRAQMVEALEAGAMPSDARSVRVGNCQVWTDPKAELHP